VADGAARPDGAAEPDGAPQREPAADETTTDTKGDRGKNRARRKKHGRR
jgi:hypothetical protein